MAGELFSEVISFAPNSATLFALLLALPILFASYVHYNLGTRRCRPDFSLSKLEAIELQRAVLLYGKVARRRQQIDRERGQVGPGWRARYRSRAKFRKKFGKELEELDSYAHDLRSTIIQLRRRPIRRCKFCIHVVSAKFALGGSLSCYSLVLTALIASCYYAAPPLWALGMSISFDTFVLWQAIEGQLLLANWIAVSFVTIAVPVFYLVRRAELYKQRRPEIRQFREFSAADPDVLIHEHAGEEEAAEEAPPTVPEMFEERRWFDVLGVSPSATIEDVKQVYKVLVKQNHPDRVQSMSPAFRELAEAETKKLNAAYAEALRYLREDLNTEQVTRAA
jgi:DnaJ domain